jgi:hypothetical protein
MPDLISVLSLFSLLDCLVPALEWPYQCVVVLLLVSFATRIQAVLSRTLGAARKVLNRVADQEIVVHLTKASGNIVDNWRARRRLHSYCEKTLHHLALFWFAVTLTPWIPIYYASGTWAVQIQLQVVRHVPKVWSRWSDFLSPEGTPETTPDSSWESRVLRPVKPQWHRLSRYPRFVQAMSHPPFSMLAQAMLCKLVLEGPAWLYIWAFRLYLLLAIAAAPTCLPLWLVAAGYTLNESAFYDCGRVFFIMVHPDRFYASLPVILPWAALRSPQGFMFNMYGVPVGFLASMTWFGHTYYFLMASQVLLGVLTAATLQRSATNDRAESKFRERVRRIQPDHDHERYQELLHNEEVSYQYRMLESFCLSWHAMLLLRVIEHGPSLLASSWPSWPLTLFGASMRLIIIVSHLSFGGWFD